MLLEGTWSSPVVASSLIVLIGRWLGTRSSCVNGEASKEVRSKSITQIVLAQAWVFGNYLWDMSSCILRPSRQQVCWYHCQDDPLTFWLKDTRVVSFSPTHHPKERRREARPSVNPANTG